MTGISMFRTNFRQFALLILAFLVASSGNKSFANTKTEPVTQQYKPAVLKLIFSVNKNNPDDSFLDTILIPVNGEPTAKRSEVLSMSKRLLDCSARFILKLLPYAF